MTKIRTDLLEAFAQMPTAQLDEMLQSELRKEDPEPEVVLGILKVLEEREADDPVLITPGVSDAWEKYKEKIAPPKKNTRKRVWFASVAAVAAVLCIVLMAIPRTVGAESVFDVLFRWTESVFEFLDPEHDESLPQLTDDFVTDIPGLQQLYEQVTELGVTEPVVPMWLPEGYELTELKVTPMPNGNKVVAKFEKDNGNVLISYRISSEIAIKFEKEDSTVEVFEVADVSHFIMDNGEKLSATWSANGAECSVVAKLEKEDLYEVIKSIYKKDL